jgi:hypothetical protein
LGKKSVLVIARQTCRKLAKITTLRLSKFYVKLGDITEARELPATLRHATFFFSRQKNSLPLGDNALAHLRSIKNAHFLSDNRYGRFCVHTTFDLTREPPHILEQNN